MTAHRAKTTLSEDGVVILRDLPFHRGESVEVIILPALASEKAVASYPLRGTPVTLTAPTDPV